MDMIKLSIIIPYYNVAQYTDELLKCLAPQIREEIEVILVDDGSKVPYKTNYKWCKIYRQTNKGVSAARNKGLELAKGEYIAFIDADDIVAGNYVDRIIKKMPFDYLDMSWKSLPGGQQFEVKLTSDTDRLKNPSAVTRAFNRSVIGTIRFNENKQAAEDAEFIMNVCKPDMKVAVITDFMYFYRTYTPNSLTKRYLSGDMETKRIVYHYEHITADMTDFVVEQGTSGIWSYRKWNNGNMECWCAYTNSIAVSTASAGYGGYRSGQLSIPTFPVTFTNAPVVIATVGSAGGVWVNNVNTVTTTGGSFYLSSGASSAATNRTIYFYVSGK